MNASENKARMIELGGKEWVKEGLDRVYITNEILNTLQDEKGLGLSCFGERNNKIFFDVETNAIMRRYKNRKPSVEIQL